MREETSSTLTERTLNTERIAAEGAAPQHWIIVLHGIYGAGRNWATVMRRVVRERPEWGALLVDLREHGQSQGFPPPHTIEASADDVTRLVDTIEPDGYVVLGHSFGGKVALVHAHSVEPPPLQVWVIDSTPQAREPDGSAWTMLLAIESLPDRFRSRDELIDALAERGLARPVAQWMATNLVQDNGIYRWRIRLDSMRQLLESFFETTAWETIESPPPGTEVHIVKAEESSVLSGPTLERVGRAAESNPATFLHTVSGGHWVNADNPAALQELLVQMLPSVG